MKYAYCRVSSQTQNIDRQIVELSKFVDERNIITDKASGKDFNREGYKLLKERLLRKGDVLYIYSIDRLGRDYTMIRDEWKALSDMGVGIKVLDNPLLDTTQRADNLTENFISDLVLSILSYVSETERKNIKARQEQGIKIAKDKGIKFGRPRAEIPLSFESEYQKWKNGEQTAVETMRKLGMKNATFYRKVKEFEDNR